MEDPTTNTTLQALEPVIAQASQIWEEAMSIWTDGGWAMIAIAVIAMVIFSVGVSVSLRLRRTGFKTVKESTWRRWLDHPYERRGKIGRLLDTVSRADTLEENGLYFEQVRKSQVSPFERDLKVMKVCVSAAPLVGLLGTVTGMLATFGALASGSGGDKTMALVAKGISEALITTETGLVIALPGLLLQYHLNRNFQRYKAFIAHLETVCAQRVYRQQSALGKEHAKKQALAEIAKALHPRTRTTVTS